MAAKSPAFPGFVSLTDQIFVREPDAGDAPAPSHHPDIVMIYGWGDGLPKHVAKYCDGFRTLYPQAKQVAVLSPIGRAMFSNLEQRSKFFLPLIYNLFPSTELPAKKPSILVHTMSNTGAVNFYATVYAFHQLYKQPFPHKLIVMDSTPGSTDFSLDNLGRWSRAMAYGTAGWFPWPFVVTQGIWATSITVSTGIGYVLGNESAGGWSAKAALDYTYEPKDARKLYMYSKEDDLIGWEDIELHASKARELGWSTDIESFQGSGHVGHMRKFPEQYWNAIKSSWERTQTL
ncbi:hypothetical protein S7711_00634 [Stachybotrys chartarum IBT 7711]|uniref:Uncharacterized protein n=1 Tax=Stachybotrys chartarum (strain CBS 109288 / IBT 7711) TaxID=1280523 RepID=A0A084ATY4_STACB|nr:hypothetical protein S7711_00634 [Stachybotrys chartarum IBT 7711]KFA48665.1 hypothetical protein S40293_04553 [Stachybotrys chartarum IBT 40293]